VGGTLDPATLQGVEESKSLLLEVASSLLQLLAQCSLALSNVCNAHAA
jgi:hypothetical protein